MLVDVHSEIEIARPPDVVARYAADPENAPHWYVNIESATWQTEPVKVGEAVRSQACSVVFIGRF